MSATEKYPAPEPNPETEPFWAAAREGKLLLKRCTKCKELHYYPRTICPFCFSDETDWVEASGSGTIYTYSVMRRVPAPYAIAYVALDEGVTLMSNIVDHDLDDLRIGQRVKLVFKESVSGQPIAMFTPA
jgi:uncharacterized protein